MISKQIYDFFAKIVFDKTGIFYPEKDYYRLDARINTLMSHYDCESAEEIMLLYQQKMNPEMETFLVDICTNNETYFFRDNKPFDSLALICEKIWKENPFKEIKIWSCASSTGQEPLSIIMSLIEKFPNISNSKISLFATDISSKALEKCKSATYSNLDVQRGLPISLLMKYFDGNPDGSWTAKSTLTDYIKYDYFNLLDGGFPDEEYDIIFCRNVLIYQDKDNKEFIMSNLRNALKPGGHIVMGAGESIIGSSVDLFKENIGESMFFKRPSTNLKAA